MAKETFRGSIPVHLLYDVENDVWVRREESGAVTVGATSYGAYFAGEILAFTPKRPGAEIERGRSLGVVEVAKTMVAIHSPLSLRLSAINDAAIADPALINADPYGKGWLVRGEPLRWETERTRLVPYGTYEQHVIGVQPGAEILR